MHSDADPSPGSSDSASAHTVSSHPSSQSTDDVSLKENLQRWLKGEHIDWSSDYAAQFKSAQEQAEKLISQDPDQAEQLALDGEKWLAQYLVSDLELMKIAQSAGNQDPAVGADKIERVEQMYNTILKRIEEREAKIQAQQAAKTEQADVAKSSHDEL